MEFRKRSRSNPLNDDNDDDLNHINNYNKSKRRCSPYRCITWIFKFLSCQKRGPKALNSTTYVSQV